MICFRINWIKGTWIDNSYHLVIVLSSLRGMFCCTVDKIWLLAKQSDEFAVQWVTLERIPCYWTGITFLFLKVVVNTRKYDFNIASLRFRMFLSFRTRCSNGSPFMLESFMLIVAQRKIRSIETLLMKWWKHV